MLDRYSNRDDLIVINSDQNPTAMYFAHRKGWVASNEQLSDTAYLNDLRDRGCRNVLIMKQTLGEEMEMPLPRLYNGDAYAVYQLR